MVKSMFENELIGVKNSGVQGRLLCMTGEHGGVYSGCFTQKMNI